MNFFEAIGAGFRGYVTWRGRSTRAEYWYWQLFIVIACLIGAIAANANSIILLYLPILLNIFGIAVILPTLSVTIRRLHDIDKSGAFAWLFMVPILGVIFLIYLFCQKGAEKSNRFGEAKIPSTGQHESYHSRERKEVSTDILLSFSDEDLHELVWNELKVGKKQEGLWARLFVKYEGDENKIKSEYIKGRVEELRAQQSTAKAEIEAQAESEAAAEEARLKAEAAAEEARLKAEAAAEEARLKAEAEHGNENEKESERAVTEQSLPPPPPTKNNWGMPEAMLGALVLMLVLMVWAMVTG